MSISLLDTALRSTYLVMQGMPLETVLVQVRKTVRERPERQRLRLDRLPLFEHLPRICPQLLSGVTGTLVPITEMPWPAH